MTAYNVLLRNELEFREQNFHTLRCLSCSVDRKSKI